MLGKCKALARLDLACNEIGHEGMGRLAEVLGECTALAHLNLSTTRSARMSEEAGGRAQGL